MVNYHQNGDGLVLKIKDGRCQYCKRSAGEVKAFGLWHRFSFLFCTFLIMMPSFPLLKGITLNSHQLEPSLSVSSPVYGRKLSFTTDIFSVQQQIRHLCLEQDANKDSYFFSLICDFFNKIIIESKGILNTKRSDNSQ